MDEHVASVVARAMTRRGFDVVTAQDAGMRQTDDSLLLDYAHRQGRVMVTQDEGYLVLHAAGQQHSGITYLRHGASPSYIIQQLTLPVEVVSREEMIGRLEYL